jgi:16S rRNA (adenine1518-N6/adenine1519-N6)-dimethyltransferase
MNKDDYSHHFKKSLGQNFLNNKKYINELVDSLDINEDELVIEIGPGKGYVTEEILKRTKNLILIEKDDSLIPYLSEKFSDSVKLIHDDVLEINFPKLTANRPYKVIGSLPYNISKRIIYNLLNNTHKPSQISLIIQKEVAKEYSSKAPKATLLSNFANLYSEVKLSKVVPSIYFTPKPKVDGQIITFSNISQKFEQNTELWRIIRTGFSSPRKILASNLNVYGKEKVIKGLLKIGLSEKARASELTLTQWIELYQLLYV